MSSLPHRCTAALVASLFTTATGSLYLAFPSWGQDVDKSPKFQFESPEPVFFELPPPQVEDEPFTEIEIQPAQPLPPPTFSPEQPQPPTEIQPPPPTFDPQQPQPPAGYNPPPYRDSPHNEFNRYRLGIDDVITINVMGFPEFNTQAILDLEGQVLMPILGLVRLRGMTLPEAEAVISYELGNRYLFNPPDVIVNLSGPRTALVTVTGEVVEPGFYELPPGSSPFDALFRAGGSTQQADLRSVLVRRTLLDGTVIEQTLDLLTPLQGGQPLPPMFLLEGDAVILSRLAVGEDQNYDRRLASRSNLAQARITVRVLNHPGQGLGALELANGSTFLDALTQISPNASDANLSAVALMRFDPEQGRPVTQMLNVRQALMGDLSQDVPLEDEDVIVIGRSLIARISYALNLFTRPFRDILGFLLFFREIGNSADTLFSP